MYSNHRTRACAIAILSASAAIAQTSPTLHGLVLDPLGARVASAHVELLANDATNTILAQTDATSDGSYSLTIPSSQRFRLRITAPTFSATTTEPLLLSATQSTVRDLTFNTPTLSEQVTVTSTGTPTPLAQSGAPISVLDQQQLPEALQIEQTLTLIPGVQTSSAAQPPSSCAAATPNSPRPCSTASRSTTSVPAPTSPPSRPTASATSKSCASRAPSSTARTSPRALSRSPPHVAPPRSRSSPTQ